ncbi:hypothetical protein JNO54_03695 [Janibacter sp. YIM B02568]|uniref:hypothetical protein n=1 Tax=Janibacter endophyticus TaxID=2806261 RepID=UPI001951F5BF|nr:hypothetical protein [Janibacter endophyticus]MBM6545243.1 hypothetical protein [Janibacter endophyticus]
MEAHGATLPGPAEAAEAAHAAAALVVSAGRADTDPELAARLVGLVDEVGLDTLAELWSDRPARSLPGALWRLYLVREWVRRQPAEASREYGAGMLVAPVEHVVAGVAEPPGPDDVLAMIDAVLGGAFRGDLDVALERCAAFCLVVATGRAHDDSADVELAAALSTTAADLAACAALWRADALV